MDKNPYDLLPQWWWAHPERALPVTMTTKNARSVLLYMDGTINACGQLYDIRMKSLGAGVQRVWIERRA